MVPSGPPLSILGTECSVCKPAPLVVPQTIGEHQPLPCAADTSKLPPISPILCQGAQQLITPVTHARRTRSTLENARSEEHTSELQSQFHLVCRLLLEKKK